MCSSRHRCLIPVPCSVQHASRRSPRHPAALCSGSMRQLNCRRAERREPLLDGEGFSGCDGMRSEGAEVRADPLQQVGAHQCSPEPLRRKAPRPSTMRSAHRRHLWSPHRRRSGSPWPAPRFAAPITKRGRRAATGAAISPPIRPARGAAIPTQAASAAREIDVVHELSWFASPAPSAAADDATTQRPMVTSATTTSNEGLQLELRRVAFHRGEDDAGAGWNIADWNIGVGAGRRLGGELQRVLAGVVDDDST